MAYLNLKPVEFDALSKKTQQAFKWEGRLLLPKYDGCFAMVAFWNGNFNYVMSRTGETVKSMDHIASQLLATYPWITSSERGLMVLGEAWTPGLEFSEISGVFRRQRAQPALGFAPFDVVEYHHNDDPDLPTLYSPSYYIERVAMLRRGTLPDDRMIYPPAPLICSSQEQAWGTARHLKAMGGFDGAICAAPYATYTPGAGKGGEFVKLKPLLSFSLEVVDYETATGEKTGRDTGALVVRFRGKTCKVATGLSNDQQRADQLAAFVGKVIEVEAMGISSGGLLREPRFKGVRDDAQPDF